LSYSFIVSQKLSSQFVQDIPKLDVKKIRHGPCPQETIKMGGPIYSQFSQFLAFYMAYSYSSGQKPGIESSLLYLIYHIRIFSEF
jgi:hypothetical protein